MINLLKCPSAQCYVRTGALAGVKKKLKASKLLSFSASTQSGREIVNTFSWGLVEEIRARRCTIAQQTKRRTEPATSISSKTPIISLNNSQCFPLKFGRHLRWPWSLAFSPVPENTLLHYVVYMFSIYFLREYYWILTTSQVVQTHTPCRIINNVIRPHNYSILRLRS